MYVVGCVTFGRCGRTRFGDTYITVYESQSIGTSVSAHTGLVHQLYFSTPELFLRVWRQRRRHASCYQTTHSGQRIQRQVTSYRPILIRCTSYARTPAEILRTVYGGNESVPGGFFPQGANGNVHCKALPPESVLLIVIEADDTFA